ncbi:hypothetical protein [Aestuariivirga litoralis]|uniref:hypothetical protein n=1 Tax=Aestuariivirga litoralis TaxID=2650924 RepID=UPI0018C57B13|nr:hypothetical protein [Aestuariivirga litoralis]MBG1230964.1 hypothetical protein [Aestuariivirga litoralis]
MTFATGQGRGFVMALGAVLALAVFAYVSSHVAWLLREPDLWWHIRSGQVMIETGHVPQVDTFSYTHDGKPWIAKEWLSQVIFAFVYAAAGWAGPLILSAAAVSFTAWLIYARATRDIQPVYAAALVILSVFVVQGVMVARPHILTFPVATGLAILLFDAARLRRAPPFWTLLLTVLWTNLHGSFSIAFVIAGCAFIDYIERARFSDRRTIIKWLAYLVLSVLVTLINPYFIQPYVIALALAGGLDVMSRISEWAPFTAPENSVMELGFMLAFFLLLKARAKFTIGQILFTLMAFHMVLSHVRFIYVFFLSVPVVLLPEIAEAVPVVSLTNWLKRPRDGLESFVGGKASAIAGIASVLFVAGCGYLLMKDRVVPPDKTAITGALAFVEKHRAADTALQKNVFNDYNLGGPLILSGIRTYVDGRAEQLFLGDFMKQYLDSGDSTGGAALAEILSDTSIGWTIFPPSDPRNANLALMPEWQKMYEDKSAVIYERKG